MRMHRKKFSRCVHAMHTKYLCTSSVPLVLVSPVKFLCQPIKSVGVQIPHVGYVDSRINEIIRCFEM